MAVKSSEIRGVIICCLDPFPVSAGMTTARGVPGQLFSIRDMLEQLTDDHDKYIRPS